MASSRTRPVFSRARWIELLWQHRCPLRLARHLGVTLWHVKSSIRRLGIPGRGWKRLAILSDDQILVLLARAGGTVRGMARLTHVAWSHVAAELDRRDLRPPEKLLLADVTDADLLKTCVGANLILGDAAERLGVSRRTLLEALQARGLAVGKKRGFYPILRIDGRLVRVRRRPAPGHGRAAAIPDLIERVDRDGLRPTSRALGISNATIINEIRRRFA